MPLSHGYKATLRIWNREKEVPLRCVPPPVWDFLDLTCNAVFFLRTCSKSFEQQSQECQVDELHAS